MANDIIFAQNVYSSFFSFDSSEQADSSLYKMSSIIKEVNEIKELILS